MRYSQVSSYLKVVSATFVLVCFLSLNESTFQTRKNVFYFTSKALFVLEKIKFQNSAFSNFMTSSNASAQNKKYISLNNLGSKYSLLMKFGQFMSYYKRKKNHPKIIQKLRPENQFQAFLYLQRIKHNFYQKMKFLKQATCIRYVVAKISKFVQISKLTSTESVLQRIL